MNKIKALNLIETLKKMAIELENQKADLKKEFQEKMYDVPLPIKADVHELLEEFEKTKKVNPDKLVEIQRKQKENATGSTSSESEVL